MTKRILISLAAVLLSVNFWAQTGKNLAELLGYPRDSKLLIIHADDMGLCNAVNTACIRAFENRGITSGSIMVPCPWTPEIAAWAKEHPGYDIGIHLTMTAEWKYYKWDGVLPADQIASLIDRNGYFYPSVEELGKVAKGEDAMKELKAQIEKAISLGVQPSHIDTHMGSVLANPELVKVYLQLSEEYHLPILFPREYLPMLPPDIAALMGSKIYLLDHLFMLDEEMAKGNWLDAYRKGFEGLKPGLNQIIVHVSVDNDEMKAISIGHDSYGSAWRQKDLDLVLSKEFKNLMIETQVIPVTWKQIGDLMSLPK